MTLRMVMLALRVMPSGVRSALDGWSYRVALKRRQRRLQLAQAK